MNFLTEAEKAELKKAHDAAVAANPDLAKQEEAFHSQMEQDHQNGTKPDEATLAQGKSLREQMDAAMIKADPDVAPILAKIKAHHPHGGPGGPGGQGGQGTPPPDSGT